MIGTTVSHYRILEKRRGGRYGRGVQGRRHTTGTATAALFDAILHKVPVSHPEVPAALAAIINKALEKDRDVRYQHASDLRADLKRFKRDTSSGRSEAAPQEPASDSLITATLIKRHKRAALGSVVVVAAKAEGRCSGP